MHFQRFPNIRNSSFILLRWKKIWDKITLLYHLSKIKIYLTKITFFFEQDAENFSMPFGCFPWIFLILKLMSWRFNGFSVFIGLNLSFRIYFGDKAFGELFFSSVEQIFHFYTSILFFNNFYQVYYLSQSTIY